jgi:hypothetical protein
VPVIGVNLARPLIEVAGRDAYDEIMMPLPLAVAQRLPCLSAGRPPAPPARTSRWRVSRARGKPRYF